MNHIPNLAVLGVLIATLAVHPVAAQRQSAAGEHMHVSAAAFDTSEQELAIYGTNFGSSPGVVTLNGHSLPILSWQDTRIAVSLSRETAGGTYRLSVARGFGSASWATLDVTIGATGPRGKKGDWA